MLALLVVLAAAAPLARLGAQVPTRPDTTRRPTAGDTIRRPAADSLGGRRDSVRVTTPVPQRPDSARTDSVRGIPDTTRSRPRADSIQTPIASAELPRDVRVGRVLRWTRDSLFTTAALTLADLLERVPGMTTFRTGWLASAQTGAYLGDFRRLRVFRDGVEMDAVDPRNGGVFDLLDFQLWQADEVAIERTAGEVRVHVRTWTTRNTTAYTRVDIATGDEDTNLYRGYYGKRWGNGLALQVGAQQLGTGTRNRLGGGGDATNPMVRLGWARGRFSVDGLLVRLDRARDLTVSIDGDSLLVPFEARRNEAYLRAAYGDTERGPWAQLVASTLAYTLQNTAGDSTIAPAPGSPAGTPADTVSWSDTTASRAQYVATVGYTLGRVRASVLDRVRVFGGTTDHAPALRLSYDAPFAGVAAFAERAGVDSARRLELTGRVTPLPWLALQGSASRITRELADTTSVARTSYQAEAAVRLGNAWVSAGLVRRAGVDLTIPTVYELGDTAALREEAASGVIVGAQGRVYKDIYVDVNGVSWGSAGRYRPQYQARVELGIATNWLRRFPSGNLGIRAAVIDEYRSRTQFVLPEGAVGGTLAELCDNAGALCAPPSNTLMAQLEIRIQRGTLWYQLRNAFNREYALVPGFTMPRPINVYGVRWEFWN